MLAQNTYQQQVEGSLSLGHKLKDYGQLVKFRLTSMVIFSTFAGYMLAPHGVINWTQLLLLLSGGFMVVGAANGLNQVIEKDLDKLMKRTENRPLAQNRLEVWEALVFCTIMGIAGVVILGVFLNQLSAFIALVSLVLYSFIYTPLKRVSPVAVFVGAIPGALPPLIGYVAVTGAIDAMAIAIFSFQFIWQFPHFWAIAWVLHDDYKRAGFKLLPLGDNKDKKGALQIMMFTLLLIPMSLVPVQLGITGWVSAIAGISCSLLFFYQSYRLFRDLSDKSAKNLMFGSFIYLPVVLITYILDKIF